MSDSLPIAGEVYHLWGAEFGQDQSIFLLRWSIQSSVSIIESKLKLYSATGIVSVLRQRVQYKEN